MTHTQTHQARYTIGVTGSRTMPIQLTADTYLNTPTAFRRPIVCRPIKCELERVRLRDGGDVTGDALLD